MTITVNPPKNKPLDVVMPLNQDTIQPRTLEPSEKLEGVKLNNGKVVEKEIKHTDLAKENN